MNAAPRRARLRALAKTNLSLKVLHRRADGYHELRTIFQTISLADIIDVEFTPARRSAIELASNIDIPGNLVLRAARAVLDATRSTGRLCFRVHKRIPVGGGLGGGSSDAAAVLLALPVLCGRHVPLDELNRLAAELGSDVPFFLLGGTALGLGRGAEVYPLPETPPLHALLLVPGLQVSTPLAYQALGRELTMPSEFRIMSSFQALSWSLGQGVSAARWAHLAENDFEAVVFKQHPQLRKLQSELAKRGARPAMLCGSGASLIGLFTERNDMERAAFAFPDCEALPVSLVSRRRYRAIWWRSLQAHLDGKLWPPQSRYAR